MKKSTRKSGFTLVEVLIVVIIMAVLAATIVPQFSSSAADANVSTAKFNLNSLRSQLQLYKAQHNGTFPLQTTFANQMTMQTDATGTTGGTGTLGPYMQAVPTDPFTNLTTVAASTANPIVVSGTAGGYIYNQTTGEIRINSSTTPTGYTAMNTW